MTSWEPVSFSRTLLHGVSKQLANRIYSYNYLDRPHKNLTLHVSHLFWSPIPHFIKGKLEFISSIITQHLFTSGAIANLKLCSSRYFIPQQNPCLLVHWHHLRERMLQVSAFYTAVWRHKFHQLGRISKKPHTLTWKMKVRLWLSDKIRYGYSNKIH